MNPPRLLSPFALAFVCGVSFLAGCADSRQGPSAGENAPPPPQPSLAGEASFFASTVAVHVSLDGASFVSGPGGGRRRGGDTDIAAPRPDTRMNPSTDEMVAMGPGIGGGGDSGMGSRGGGGMGRGGGGGFDGPHESGPPPGEGSRGARLEPPGFSPVRQIIRVVFTNHGPSPAALTVVEVKSLLGDFAPRPENFSLAAGQSAPLNELRSSVAENVEELDMTITLRRGADRETKVVHLARVPSPSGPPARPPQ